MPELPDELALVQIPKHDCTVSTSADKVLTIGANAEAVDRASMKGEVVNKL